MPRETLAPASGTAAPGFYGKVPARGDFVSRYLSRRFLDPWDDWLQQALACSRQQLGERWLDGYLTSPLWRFALSAGACGAMPFAGVWMPSVDRVGRYFPLMIAAPLNGCRDLLGLASHANDWFEQAEQLALAGLADHLDLEDFATQVQALGLPPSVSGYGDPRIANDTAPAWHCPLNNLAELDTVPPLLTGYLLEQYLPHYSLWWSNGSERIAPCLLICPGLPPVDRFAALLTGDWAQWGWGERPLAMTAAPACLSSSEGSHE